ncbi:MAG: ImmA/IrrE family metallo-endopeptidase [Planctomycetia bacterium]|nr:ImmA/IrrE family metallo-endopeptidase [Planctomycetia bacterium]
MHDELPREEVVDVLDRVIDELLDAAGVVQPPVDVIALAQTHLKMVVCLDRRQQTRGRAQRASGGQLICLRPEPTEERHQWTVAHEIGEHWKADLLARLGIDPEGTGPMAGESLANLFAYRLLAPSRWFAADAPACDYDLLQLKARYRTASHEVLAWRLLDLPAPCIITIVDNERVYRRRSNGIRVTRRLGRAEEDCLRRVHEHGRPVTVRHEPWTVQGWPVHRPDWKREVLRAVFDGDD